MALNLSEVCPVCHENFDNYGFGRCNHPTCVKCAVKLRIFENVPGQLDFSNCPTCRQKLGSLILTETWAPFDEKDTSSMMHDTEYDILFESRPIQEYYKVLMTPRCGVCRTDHPNMSALNRHSSNEHKLSFCDLCLRNAKLLPCEFEPMTREDLANHRKAVGERGHPLCGFCNERYYDKDSLLQHVRAQHFVCDLCSRQRKHMFFNSHKDLTHHYETEHMICTLCRGLDVVMVFSTPLELQHHRVNEHPDQLTRDDTCLQLPRGQRPTHRGGVTGGGGSYSRGGGAFRRDNNHHAPHSRDAVGGMEDSFAAAAPHPTEFIPQATDFPTLSGDTPELATAIWTNAPAQPPPPDVEDVRTAFSAALISGHSNVVNASQQQQPPIARALQGEVTGTYRAKAHKGMSGAAKLTDEDFPALDSGPTVKFVTPAQSTAPHWGRGGHSGSQTHQSHPIPVTVHKNQNSFFNKSMPTAVGAKPAFKNDNDFPGLPAKVSPAPKLSFKSAPAANTTASVVATGRKEGAFAVVETRPSPAVVHTAPSINVSSNQDFPGLPAPASSVNGGNKPTGAGKKNQKNKKSKKTNLSTAEGASPSSASLSTTAESSSRMDYVSTEDFTSRFAGVQYQAPEDFNQRNELLYRELQSLLTAEEFAELVQMAQKYIQREMFPAQLWETLQRLLGGSEQSFALLPELIVLLQDIGLQRSLFRVLPKERRGGLVECYECGQVCHDREKQNHLTRVHKKPT